MATHDHLTSLFNRREAYRKLGEELAISLQSQQPLSLLLIDLDHFKQVNDTHGHSAGDIVLQSVAGAMRQCIGLDGFCCRYGGEEFLVVLPGANLETAIAVAEKLRLQIEKLEMPVSPGTLLHITTSIGVATLTGGETVDQLISRADSAMYFAKQLGRNRVSSMPSPDPNQFHSSS
jgi:diguanylate cyclase (GGDEF)-like protein